MKKYVISLLVIILVISCSNSKREECDLYLIYEGAYAQNQTKVPEIYGIDLDKTGENKQMVLKYTNGKKEVLEVDFVFSNYKASEPRNELDYKFIKALQKYPDDALIVMLKNGHICWFEFGATGAFNYSTDDNLFVYPLDYKKTIERVNKQQK